MRILVVGARGLVGAHVLAEALSRGHPAEGTSRQGEGFRPLELAEGGAIERALDAVSPDAVVCAAGWTWVDGCERDPSESRRRNLDQPLALARACARRSIRLLHFSSSYVFDGAAGCYDESAPVAPINVYGRDKAESERAILEATDGTAILARLICVWGREADRKNFAYQVMRAAAERRALELPDDQLGNPSWAGDIAAWSVRLLEARATGIWHLAGDHPETTRLEWARSILAGLARQGLPASAELVCRPTRVLGQMAPRPLRAGLATDKVQRFHPLACRRPDDLPRGFADADAGRHTG